ncbi:MAG: helix-turn-helix domain-containing protein [Lachnospiraceae bacterium]|nr:helix-turn-helix domain-containing protein [Lachnospiraceae bacterium]
MPRWRTIIGSRTKENPDISQEALGENMGVTRRVVQKYIMFLKKPGE